MPAQPPFIMDSCSLMESKNRYYAFDICPRFWDFLLEEFDKGNVISIHHVYEEIKVGNDELTSWLTSNFKKKSFVDCLSDSDTVVQYLRIAEYVKAEYKPNLAEDFLKESSADPWLIAEALAHGGCVVTQEQSRPSKSKASLYDICDHFDVHHIDIIEFLHIERARFVYDRTA